MRGRTLAEGQRALVHRARTIRAGLPRKRQSMAPGCLSRVGRHGEGNFYASGNAVRIVGVDQNRVIADDFRHGTAVTADDWNAG